VRQLFLYYPTPSTNHFLFFFSFLLVIDFDQTPRLSLVLLAFRYLRSPSYFSTIFTSIGIDVNMHLPTLLIFLCAQVVPSTLASHFFIHSQSITKRIHDVALKRSAGLAKDLRVALGGALITRRQQPSNSSSQKRSVYCVSTNGGGAQIPLGGGGNSTTRPSTGTSTATSTVKSTATSTSSGPAPSSTSSWKLTEAHVSFFVVLMSTRC
jgi:hypothetical protein